MKNLFYLLILSSTLFSCKSGSNSDEATLMREDSLKAIIDGNEERMRESEESLQAFIKGFNQIQENLDIIKQKEGVILSSSQNSKEVKSKEEQIVADIQAIYDIMNKNRMQLASMKKKLSKSNSNNEELNKLIERLNADIETKNSQIADLRTQLEQMNVSMTELRLEYKEVSDELEEKNKQLNTAYYAYGTSKELIKNGVLTKEGGFIGIGKIQKMKEDFNQGYFTEVEISNTNSIVLAAKSAKLITTHPADSYKFEGKDESIEKLTILKPETFWKASKYLVIVVE